MTAESNTANFCFGCGTANARGMKLVFLQDDAAQRIRGALRLGAEYQGGPGIIHGGIIATVMDEAMSKVSRFRQIHAVTAELVVEYLKPVRVDEDLVIEAYEVERNGRALWRVGEIRSLPGEVLAKARGRFVEIDAAALRR